jgi:hypothetical protein
MSTKPSSDSRSSDTAGIACYRQTALNAQLVLDWQAVFALTPRSSIEPSAVAG